MPAKSQVYDKGSKCIYTINVFKPLLCNNINGYYLLFLKKVLFLYFSNKIALIDAEKQGANKKKRYH